MGSWKWSKQGPLRIKRGKKKKYLLKSEISYSFCSKLYQFSSNLEKKVKFKWLLHWCVWQSLYIFVLFFVHRILHMTSCLFNWCNTCTSHKCTVKVCKNLYAIFHMNVVFSYVFKKLNKFYGRSQFFIFHSVTYYILFYTTIN